MEWHRLCEHLASFTATALGKKAAQQLPIPQEKHESLYLLAQTKEAYQLELTLDQGLSFGGIRDCGAALLRSQKGGVLSGGELQEIAGTLAGMRRLRRLLESREDAPTLQDLIGTVRTYPELEQEIHHCIDDHGEVTDRASPILAELRLQIKGLRERIYGQLQRIMQRHSGAMQESVISKRGDRFVIPVKASQKEQIGGIVHDVSGTGSTFYLEPKAIVELGNQFRQKERQAQREIEKVLAQLSDKVGAVVPDLEHLLAVATILDLAVAKARYSLWLNANPPRLLDSDRSEKITLHHLRHPLLLWQQRQEKGAEVVPINLHIQPQTKVVAITGPNTGGKTVTLKTFGLAALMAKVGLFIPAKAPVEIPWFREILADIGDEQSLEQSLSTFSGHIRRIIRIMAVVNAQPRETLVLLDEVGAGTDPTEGSALAIALLKQLAAHSGLTIATTHYGELKALKYEDDRFENASVEFNDETLQPTYKLLWGIPGRSNALAIAQRLGLDGAIVAQADQLLQGQTQDVNEVIAALEAQRREQEEKARQAQELLAQTEKFYAEVSSRAQELQARETELKRSQEQEVQAAIAEAKGEIAQVIRKLQRGKTTAQKAQQATAQLNTIAQNQLPVVATPKPSYRPQVGEKIRISRLDQTAEVLEINGEALVVRFGIMKMALEMGEIESLKGEKVEPPPPPPKKPVEKKAIADNTKVMIRTSKNTLDLRGQRMHAAERQLDQAIAEGAAQEQAVLWIIHGKGTGRLRQGVHDFLKSHPQVARYELADQKDGGGGVTIAHYR